MAFGNERWRTPTRTENSLNPVQSRHVPQLRMGLLAAVNCLQVLDGGGAANVERLLPDAPVAARPTSAAMKACL